MVGCDDRSIPLEQVEALSGEMRARGVEAGYHVCGAGHACANDARPGVYNADAAALAWERTFAFFGRHLA